MTVISMSRVEIVRMNVLKDLMSKRITASGAAQLMGVTTRQVFRLAKAFREAGPSALVSCRRGRPSNRSSPATLRIEALALITAHYGDLGPTLACEKLAQRHGLHLVVETVRQWMLAAGIWKDRQQRRKIDGSEHWWFEDRSPQCTLLVFIDDATSRLMHLRFVPSESTFDYFEATRAYLQQHGKPVAFYSDKHGVFRIMTSSARRAGKRFRKSLHGRASLHGRPICPMPRYNRRSAGLTA